MKKSAAYVSRNMVYRTIDQKSPLITTHICGFMLKLNIDFN